MAEWFIIEVQVEESFVSSRYIQRKSSSLGYQTHTKRFIGPDVVLVFKKFHKLVPYIYSKPTRSIRGCRAAVSIVSSKTGGEDRVVLDAQTKIMKV